MKLTSSLVSIVAGYAVVSRGVDKWGRNLYTNKGKCITGSELESFVLLGCFDLFCTDSDDYAIDRQRINYIGTWEFFRPLIFEEKEWY